MVDEQILFFLFQEGFSDLLQVLNPAFFLDLLKVLVDQVHVFFVLINYFYLFLVLRNQIS